MRLRKRARLEVLDAAIRFGRATRPRMPAVVRSISTPRIDQQRDRRDPSPHDSKKRGGGAAYAPEPGETLGQTRKLADIVAGRCCTW